MRDRLGIPLTGTVVTLNVTHAVACPRHDTLKQVLGNHVQLRDIMQDPDRDVFLLLSTSRALDLSAFASSLPRSPLGSSGPASPFPATTPRVQTCSLPRLLSRSRMRAAGARLATRAFSADFTGFGHPVSREMATLFRRNWPPCFTGNGHPLG
jgi:hypothetical protein